MRPASVNVEEIMKELVVEAEDDWLMSWDVYWRDESASTPAERVSSAIDVVDRLVQRGWMTIGQPSEGRFVPWDLTHDEALAAARRELCNTELGDRVARDLIANGYELP